MHACECAFLLLCVPECIFSLLLPPSFLCTVLAVSFSLPLYPTLLPSPSPGLPISVFLTSPPSLLQPLLPLQTLAYPPLFFVIFLFSFTISVKLLVFFFTLGGYLDLELTDGDSSAGSVFRWMGGGELCYMYTWRKKKILEKLLYRANASPGWNKLSKEETHSSLEDEEEAAGKGEQEWHVKTHDNEEK